MGGLIVPPLDKIADFPKYDGNVMAPSPTTSPSCPTKCWEPGDRRSRIPPRETRLIEKSSWEHQNGPRGFSPCVVVVLPLSRRRRSQSAPGEYSIVPARCA